MTICLILHFAAKTALTHGGMDSYRPLKVCCGIWTKMLTADLSQCVYETLPKVDMGEMNLLFKEKASFY